MALQKIKLLRTPLERLRCTGDEKMTTLTFDLSNRYLVIMVWLVDYGLRRSIQPASSINP